MDKMKFIPSIFLAHITSYNHAFSMVSIAHKQVHHTNAGPPIYTIERELRHHMGALLPEPGADPVYAQIYFQSNKRALEICIGCTTMISGNNSVGLNNEQSQAQVLLLLQDLLHRHHAYIGLYKTALERLQEAGNAPNLWACLEFSAQQDQRRYNIPTVDEVAVIIPGDGSQPTGARDIILATQGGQLRRIYEIKSSLPVIILCSAFSKR